MSPSEKDSSMSDAEWLRGIADSGWNADEWSPEVKAMLRRVADRLDEADRLEQDRAAITRLEELLGELTKSPDAS
jgi:hypothetical protein